MPPFKKDDYTSSEDDYDEPEIVAEDGDEIVVLDSDDDEHSSGGEVDFDEFEIEDFEEIDESAMGKDEENEHVANKSVEESDSDEAMETEEGTDEDSSGDDESESGDEEESVSDEDESEESEEEEDIEDVEGEHPEEEESGKPEIVRSASEWQKAIAVCEVAEDLEEEMKTIRPFKKCEKTGRIVAQGNLDNLIGGFVLFMDSGKTVNPKVMRGLCDELFGACDLFYLISLKLQEKIKTFKNGDHSYTNVFNFLKSMPNPTVRIPPPFFETERSVIRAGDAGKKRFLNAYQDAWLELMKAKLPGKLLVKMIPHVTTHVLDALKKPHLTSDFFFKCFNKGSILAILSLGAIFRLMVNHNFEYPDFYEVVYKLTQPDVCYMNHKDKFFQLLDTFLTSTHLPGYIAAGFAKRLSRLLLWAPADAQRSIIMIIRNMIIRIASLHVLVHRPNAEQIEGDPYDEKANLTDCKAMESSLWEFVTLQKHYHVDIAKQSRLVAKPFYKGGLESFVRYFSSQEIFKKMMLKKYGMELADKNAKLKLDLDKEDGKQKKLTKKQERALRRQSEKSLEEYMVTVNDEMPDPGLLAERSGGFEYSKYFAV